MTAIAENLSVVRKRIEEACLRCGRNPSDVRLVGVTKTVPVERIREGVLAGITILGENYIQEARKKNRTSVGYEGFLAFYRTLAVQQGRSGCGML